MAEEVHHARACHTPTLDSMYGPICGSVCKDDNAGMMKELGKGAPNCAAAKKYCEDEIHGPVARKYCQKTCNVPSWQGLSYDFQGRWKFVKGHFDFDKVLDFGWCELQRGTKRCQLDKQGTTLINGGLVLSSRGCERLENKAGKGNAQIQDAPLVFLDPVKDVVCSCSYPRCFGGELVSQYELTSATGDEIGLRSLAKIGKTPVAGPMFPALKRKLKNCCAHKTKAYVRYAQEECGSGPLTNLCAAPNGYEPRFENEGLGADKHFPSSPCIAQAWTKFEMLSVAEKNEKAQQLTLKTLARLSSGLNKDDVVDVDVDLADAVEGTSVDLQLDDAVRGKEAMDASWPAPDAGGWSDTPTPTSATSAPQYHGDTPTPSTAPEYDQSSSGTDYCEF